MSGIDPIAYYNENDPFAAAWLRELIEAEVIAYGIVDERSIEEITPDELEGYTQCHFFAGIGVWSYALREAGWPDDRPVWTGSCPCQPFSAAGKGAGTADERHLWPSWFWLIEQCKPDTIFGEQVTAAIKHGWLDLVQDDLEGVGYAVGAHGLAACNLGAPHQRKRLYFVADSSDIRCEQRGTTSPHEIQGQCAERSGEHPQPRHHRELSRGLEGLCSPSVLAESDSQQLRAARSRSVAATAAGMQREDRQRERFRNDIGECGANGNSVRSSGTRFDRMAYSEPRERGESGVRGRRETTKTIGSGSSAELTGNCQTDSSSGFTNGFWVDAEWLWCRDEKYRPVEPGTFPLAHRVTNRVGMLRGYGNAIVAPVAQEFIEAYLEVTGEHESA